MKRTGLLVISLAAFGSLVAVFSSVVPATAQAQPQTTPVVSKSAPGANLSPTEVDRIVRTFTAKETQFRQALNQYGFKRDAVVQSIGFGGQVAGEYHRVSRFVFDDSGKRYEKIIFFPQPTLTDLSITPEDLEDFGGVQAFALETSKVDQYNITYVGKEKIDDLNLYVFDVAPKVTPDPKRVQERFFQGRIWVDDQDLQIVKARGKGVPEGKQRFPTFETYREQIDGKYWFPTYTYADDSLVFDGGQVVHLRERITFSDFEKFRAKVRIIEDDNVTDQSNQPTPAPSPAKKKP